MSMCLGGREGRNPLAPIVAWPESGLGSRAHPGHLAHITRQEISMKRLVIDLDGTITNGESSDYENVGVNEDVAARLREYKAAGFEIVLHTARNMRTHQSSVGKINAHTLPVIFRWLEKHDIPYDEVWVGKPWCGSDGFYVDDKAIRPDEFASMSYEEVRALLRIGVQPDAV
jgi:capsule biosynthesis phosphatase